MIQRGDVMEFVSRLQNYCEKEWESFGKQEFDVDMKMIHKGHQEFESGESERIGEYWQRLGYNIDGRDRDWPWSAAFVSFMEYLAGAGTFFHYSIRHADYMNQAIRDRDNKMALYNGYRINEVPIKIGDILGYSRAGANVNYDNAIQKGRYTSHSDIVVDVSDTLVTIIGGNVHDSVSKRYYKLTDGKLESDAQPWVCHMSFNDIFANQ